MLPPPPPPGPPPSHKQVARAKKTTDVEVGNPVKPGTSLNFVRIMLEATLGTFLYLRYIFPDEHFETIELRKETLLDDPAEEVDMPSTLVAEDSQVPASQQVVKALITQRVVANGSRETRQFLERLEGIIEAVGLGYLRSLILYIVLDPDRPNQVLETVTFNFTYTPEGPSCILTRDVNSRTKKSKKTQSAAVMTTEQVYKAMKAVIRDFVKESQDMPDLPGMLLFRVVMWCRPPADSAEQRSLNFKVFYSDDAPAELSVRLASVAGHLKPSTDIEAMADAPSRSPAEQERRFEKHLDDAEQRNVVWDAETSVLNPRGLTQPLGVEAGDGSIHPLPPSQARSEVGSDEGVIRMYARGHGERHTNLKLVHDSEPWGVEDMFIATQVVESAPPMAHISESQETTSIPSEPETQTRPRSAQVTGSLSQVRPIKDISDDSSPDSGLLSSDNHTDPSSQEFTKKKDNFQGASTRLPSAVVKAKKSRKGTDGSAQIARSQLTKRPKAKPKPASKAPAKPRAPKKKATGTSGETAAAAKPKRKPRTSGSDETPSGSSESSPAKSKKKAAAPKSKGKAKSKAVPEEEEARDDSPEGSGDGEAEVDCGCGFHPEDFAGEYVMCDGCDKWKHAVCMGAIRLEKLGSTFHCVMCRIEPLELSDETILDSQGYFHSLCLLRQILYAARITKIVHDIPALSKKFQCSIADATALLNRLTQEGLLRVEQAQRGEPSTYHYVDSQENMLPFQRYFTPGGRKELAEIPGLADASQLPSSQMPASQLPESQSQSQFQYFLNNSQLPSSQAGPSHTQPRRIPTQNSALQDDIEMSQDAVPLKSSSRSLIRNRSHISPIPESDPIEEFNSTYAPNTNGNGQETLGMDIDDPIDNTPVNSTSTANGRRFDRAGKRKATDDALGMRPTARLRSATGMGFIHCPFVEI